MKFENHLNFNYRRDISWRPREREEWADVPKDGTLVSNAESMSGHTHIPPVYAVPPSQGLQTLGFLHFKPSQMPSQRRPKCSEPSQRRRRCPVFVSWQWDRGQTAEDGRPDGSSTKCATRPSSRACGTMEGWQRAATKVSPFPPRRRDLSRTGPYRRAKPMFTRYLCVLGSRTGAVPGPYRRTGLLSWPHSFSAAALLARFWLGILELLSGGEMRGKVKAGGALPGRISDQEVAPEVGISAYYVKEWGNGQWVQM